jgi:transcriptional regulator with XRE-family HTH domain
MELQHLLAKAHLCVELNSGERISQKEMANKLGISLRTYSEYLNGGSSPIGVEALLDLLILLKDEQIIDLMNAWKNKNNNK